jgi:hypothetical protein
MGRISTLNRVPGISIPLVVFLVVFFFLLQKRLYRHRCAVRRIRARSMGTMVAEKP